jgi:hypothetical protein
VRRGGDRRVNVEVIVVVKIRLLPGVEEVRRLS